MRKRLLSAVQRLCSKANASLDDATDLLWAHGKEQDALLYALLYLPEFIEIDGSVILFSDRKDHAERFIECKKAAKWPLHEIEDSFNFVETSHIFDSGKIQGLTNEDDKLFAECIAEAWRGRLALRYPNRQFKLSVVGPSESGDAYGVSFHEIRPAGRAVVADRL